MFVEGQLIEHKDFGSGTVISVEERTWAHGLQDTPIVTVEFTNDDSVREFTADSLLEHLV